MHTKLLSTDALRNDFHKTLWSMGAAHVTQGEIRHIPSFVQQFSYAYVIQNSDHYEK